MLLPVQVRVQSGPALERLRCRDLCRLLCSVDQSSLHTPPFRLAVPLQVSHHIHTNDEVLDEDVSSMYPLLRFDTRLPLKW